MPAERAAFRERKRTVISERAGILVRAEVCERAENCERDRILERAVAKDRIVRWERAVESERTEKLVRRLAANRIVRQSRTTLIERNALARDLLGPERVQLRIPFRDPIETKRLLFELAFEARAAAMEIAETLDKTRHEEQVLLTAKQRMAIFGKKLNALKQ